MIKYSILAQRKLEIENNMSGILKSEALLMYFNREGITNIRIYQSLFHHYTCYEMLKSSEHEKLRRYTNYEPQNLKDCSEVRLADPPI